MSSKSSELRKQAAVIRYTQAEFIRPNGKFKIPNLKHKGLLPMRIVFDTTSIPHLQNIKEFKIKVGGNDIIKGMDSAFFNHQLFIDLEPYESAFVACTGVAEMVVIAKPPASQTEATKVSSLYLTFTIEYKTTVGEVRQSFTALNMEELYRELRKITNPYRISFKPKNKMPQGFIMNTRIDVDDFDYGFDILDLETIQSVKLDGGIVEWNFSFISDSIFREHFCLQVDPVAPKNVNIFPIDIVVYSAPE